MSFQISRHLNANSPNNNFNAPKCPSCKSKNIILYADNRHARIYCNVCFNEENYVRINKNDL